MVKILKQQSSVLSAGKILMKQKMKIYPHIIPQMNLLNPEPTVTTKKMPTPEIKVPKNILELKNEDEPEELDVNADTAAIETEM